MNGQGNLRKLSFLKFVGKRDIDLGEISIVELEQDSWSVEVKTFPGGIETSSFQQIFSGESDKKRGLGEILKTFSAQSGWFEYVPQSLRLFVNQDHSQFVEIVVLDDPSEKSNILIRTLSQEVETFREALSFPNESQRWAYRRELSEKYSHANGWYEYSSEIGWDELDNKTSLPVITSYVKVYGQFEDDYEFFDVSNRNEAKGRAEIEFADYSVIDRVDNEVFGFENWDTKTKAVKATDGSTYMQASVTGRWWSAYYPVEAVCLDEAEQLFLNENANRFAVVGSWDPDAFIEFNELRPQGTSRVQSATLPPDLRAKLEAVEAQASSVELKIADLEWIFFGAMNYQREVFGGNLPVINYGESGTEFFQKWGEPNFGSEVGFYWPQNEALSEKEEGFLLGLFLRYRLLWNGKPKYGEFLSLEIAVIFEMHSLRTPKVRDALVEIVEHQSWGKHSFLAAETIRLLQDTPAFDV